MSENIVQNGAALLNQLFIFYCRTVYKNIDISNTLLLYSSQRTALTHHNTKRI